MGSSGGSNARYFDDGYLRRWRLRPALPEQIEAAAGFLSLCAAGPRPRILDAGCGHGRYARPMAERGARVVGLDASMPLLRRAHSHAAGLVRAAAWVRGDLGALPFSRCFDAAVVIDAFGYFDEDGEDEVCVRELRRVLTPGGRLVLRNPNGALIRSDFRPIDEEEREERHITIRSELDASGRWLTQQVTVEDAGGTGEYARHVRIYSSAELEELVEAVGFSVEAHYSSPSGDVFDADASARMVSVCRRLE